MRQRLAFCTYPPRERWVCDVEAYIATGLSRGSIGYNIKNPLLTKWVCSPGALRCRRQHQEPTSYEVGILALLTEGGLVSECFCVIDFFSSLLVRTSKETDLRILCPRPRGCE